MKFINCTDVINYVLDRLGLSAPSVMGSIKSSETIWDPMEVFQRPPNHTYAVIILNQPILLSKDLIFPMWKQAQITMTVDGGTNRWVEYLGNLADDIYNNKYPEYVPTLITGDLDSISPSVLSKFHNIGTKVIPTYNQNFTDYSKALMQLSAERIRRNLTVIQLNAVYVVVESAGRFDQIMANINTLYKSAEFIDRVDVIIHVASNSLTWLLRPGKHVIKIPEVLRKNRAWVGLIPIGSAANGVTTTGLKWNLEDGVLAFGGMVSTSNTYGDSPEVTVSTTTPVVWTMGIEPLVDQDSTPS